ncbi:MAG: hypothetical protein RLZZ501_234, partial [Pseudomonadota bacterium]
MTLDVVVAGQDRFAALCREVVTLLPHADRPPGEEDDLIAFGLDSLHVMRLVASLRQAGADITFAALIERPTLAAWRALLDPRAPMPAPSAPADPTDPAEPDPARPFGLTDVQHAYWIGRRDDQPLGGVGCHAYLELDGRGLEPTRLAAAWHRLIHRHGMLRATFDQDGTQHVPPPPARPDPLPLHDLRDETQERTAAALAAVRDRLSHRRLRVEAGEVAGLELSLLPDGATRLHFDLDLLVADVHSLRILLRDLAAAYRDEAVPPAPAGWSFAVHLAEDARRRQASHEIDRAYWRQRLATLPNGPALPLARPPAEATPPRFTRRGHRLTPAAWEALRAAAARHRITPALVLATAYAETLARWSESPRFLLNLPLFDRQGVHAGLEEVVADFTNLLLLDVACDAETDFVAQARRLQQQVHADIDHAGYSGVRVLRDLARLRPDERVAAPVVFACNLDAPLIDDTTRAVLGELGEMISQTPQVWLDHQVYRLEGGLLLAWDAVEDLFPPGLLDAMFAAYVARLETLAADPAAWERPAPAALPPSQRAVRDRVNATRADYRPRRLEDDLFRIAAADPGRVALIEAGRPPLAFGALAHRALQLAALLLDQGLQPGEPVAVTLPRGADQVIAVLGVLAAGGCYVPVGPDQPPARQARIHRAAGIRRVVIPPDLVQAAGRPPLAGPRATAPDQPAYIIFTSGSTGEPKGVEVTHRAAINTIDAVNRRHRVGPDDRGLAVSALDFDLSVYDLFGLLGTGAALVLIDGSERRDPAAWLRLVRRHRVTVWNSVPVLLDMLLVMAEAEPDPLPLRLALVSGDWVGLDLPDRFAAATAGAGRMVALGGATEAAIWSNACEIDGPPPPHWRSIPYGQPLPNQSYRVVDALGRDCPDWVAGELWIGGDGLATGYRGDPDLTARRFVHQHGHRWYRTGDRGRYWPDGTLEFLGRLDHQIKLRGHRIELGEVEAALHALPGVRQAVAVAIGSPPTLAAALVADAAGPGPDALIRAALAERLPDYMIPTTLARLAALPLSANGKVDRAALAARLAEAAPGPAETAEPPRDERERQVAALWGEVLDLDPRRIRRDDDFFRIGGDSLLATRLVARLGHRGLRAGHPLRLLFAHPVLSDFAAGLETGTAEAATTIEPDPQRRDQPFPLTEVQQAYRLGQDPGLPLACGTRYFLELDGAGVDLVRLEAGWNRLIARHEMLRAVLTADGQQQILRTVPPLRIGRDPRPAADAAEASRRLRTRMEHQPADRTRWPLFDLHAVNHGAGRCRLGLTVDYLLLDGFSVKLLLGELIALYRDPAAPLPPLGLSFRDYVLQTAAAPATLARDLAYWRGRLDDLPPAPALPLARDPATIAPVRFHRREARLTASSWRTLRAEARRHGLTPSALLLTAYAETLARWSGGDPLTLTLTLFDRREVHPDINRILGDFTTLAPVAIHPAAGERGFLELARRVRGDLAEGLEHRAVSAIWVQRERARRVGLAAATLPVVFTSTLGLGDDLWRGRPDDFPAPVGGQSETPQVWLDHQVYEIDDHLLLTWDAI